MVSLQQRERDACLFHLVFVVVAVLLLWSPGGLPQGWRIFILLVAYPVGLLALAHRREHHLWKQDLALLVPLSALQVFPDWFLSSVLGVLVFPDATFPKIGTVTAYMAGMWTIPLFVVVVVARGVEERDLWGTDRVANRRLARLAAATTAGLLFVGAEATLWRLDIWHAVEVHQIGSVALYVVVPEILLGVTTYEACRWSARRPWFHKVTAALAVMWIYLGSLSTFFLLIDN